MVLEPVFSLFFMVPRYFFFWGSLVNGSTGVHSVHLFVVYRYMLICFLCFFIIYSLDQNEYSY